MDALLHAGKHLRGTHGHVVHRKVLAGKARVAEQDIRHEINDIAGCEVCSGLLAVAFIETAHKVFKHITAVHGGNSVRPKVALGGVELLDDQIERVAFHHALDDVVKLKLGKHVLHVAGEARQIIAEVGFDVLRVGKQGFKRVAGGVVELIAGCAGEEAIHHFQHLYLFICFQHLGMRGQKAVVKALDHRHGQNDQTVFVRLERAAQHVRHVPDKGCFFSNVDAYVGDIAHAFAASLSLVVGMYSMMSP